jgi:lysophospholipase L1-like esterase
MRTRMLNIAWMAAVAVMTVLGTGTAGVSAQAAPAPGSTATKWVASWAASPTDALVPIDASANFAPIVATAQTFRNVISPHLGGSQVRVHLTNRFGSRPVRFGAVTIAHQTAGSATDAPVSVTFGGSRNVTVAAGADVVSDPVSLSFSAFQRLAVTAFVSGLADITKHWNGNATTYYTAPLTGDRTSDAAGTSFRSKTLSWLFVNGLDVLAPESTRALVAFGDSITDGFVSASPVSVPADAAVADTDQRYPDFLQRRLTSANAGLSVVNAGIGSNMVLTNGQPLMLGPAGVERFKQDALGQAGIAGVIILEGINDLGIAHSSAAQIIAGLQNLVDQAHAAGVSAWLGTILPAAGAIVDGTLLAPASEVDRQTINAWIRSQHSAEGVIDFDAALRDPQNPSNLLPQYASVDKLHPSPAGYRAMADAVNIALISLTIKH